MATHFIGGLAMRPVVVPADDATITLFAKNSGKVHLIPDLNADTTFTLPSAEDGLAFTLVYTGTAADAHDWTINTASTSTLFKGGVVHLDTDANDAGDEVVPVDANQSDEDTLTVNVPFVGTVVNLVSDGTSWYAYGQVVSATAPAFS